MSSSRARVAEPANAAVVRQLTLYDSFDASASPEYSAGVATIAGRYTPQDGCVRRGISFHDTEGIRFQSQLNLDQTIGTLCFWFRPDGAYFNRKSATATLFSLANSNFQVVAYPGEQVMYFMTGTQLPGHNFEWDYASQFAMEQLKANHWSHISITWNADTGDKEIFVDGKSVCKSSSALMRRGSIKSEIHFASAPGTYDELAIWNRQLTPAEIAGIAADPASLAAAAVALPHQADANPWQIYPGLVYTTFTQPLLEPGRPFLLKLPLTNRTQRSQKARITAQCIDLWDQPAGDPLTVDLEMKAGEIRSVDLSMNPKRLGVFRVQVQVEAGAFKRMRDVTSFAVLPAGSPPVHPFFGAHVNAADDIPEACRRLGIVSNRVHNMTQFTWWARMQPTPNHWEMAGKETYNRYNALGFTHLGQWFATPNWAAVGPDGTIPTRNDEYPSGWIPTNVDALRAYVRESLKRFPDIHDWEIWNEPHVSMFWFGSPKQYAELCAIIYEEARKARSDISVYAQINPEGPWARAVFEAGVMDHCDGLSFHYYTNADGDPQGAAADVAALRELIKKYSKKDPLAVPLIQSEGAVVGSTFLRGLDFPDMVSESSRDPLAAREAAAMYVKSRVVLLSCGVKRDYYYVAMPFTPPLHDDFSLFDVTNGPKPKAVAMNQLIWQLDGGKFDRQITGLPDGLRSYLFHRNDGKTLAVLFAENGARFEVADLGTRFDLMGNPMPATGKFTVDAMPAYVVDGGHSAAFASKLNAATIRILTPADVKSVAKVVAPKHMDDFPVAAELGRDRLFPVDLSVWTNAPLADNPTEIGKRGWTAEGAFNDGRMIPNGKTIWLGVPTLIAGKSATDNSVITLFGRNTSSGPRSVTIPMSDKKARGLFFIHAASWASGQLGEYVIDYADGKQISLPIKAGENIGDWWTDRTDGEESRTVAFKHPEPLETDKPYRFVRIWYWENPKSDVAIRSVTIRKSSDSSNLVLLGLTRASW